jgi:hypothetical protein
LSVNHILNLTPPVFYLTSFPLIVVFLRIYFCGSLFGVFFVFFSILSVTGLTAVLPEHQQQINEIKPKPIIVA